jgi:hypothetical protein
MGDVWKLNQSLVRNYVDEPQGSLVDFVVDPSLPSPQTHLAALSTDEATEILKKLDSMASPWGPQVMNMVTEGASGVIAAVRWLKAQPGVGLFRGVFAQGSAMDLRWLDAKDVGGVLLRGRSVAAGTLGLYGGTGGAVYTWLYTMAANATNTMIPMQTMDQYAAMVYFGFIDAMEVPTVSKWQLALSGVNFTIQPADFRMIKTFDGNEMPTVKFEKPVLVGPMVQQTWSLYSFRAGDTRIQPIAILVARAQDMLSF